MNKTYIPLKKEKQTSWHIVNAENKTLGRLSTHISKLLQGKNQIRYTPGSDSLNYVIVINAEKIKITGKKLEQKLYYKHTGKPGETKTQSLGSLLTRFPTRVIELSVKRMLPNGFEKSNLVKRLRVYAGSDHPHKSQNPKEITFNF